MFKTLSLALSIFLFAPTFAKQEKCHALVMSGGANRGAYELGVIHGLVNILKEGETKWDVLTGVSAGALNSLIMSLFPIG